MKIIWSNEVAEWYRENRIQNYVDSKGIICNEPILPSFLYSEKLEFNTNGITPNQNIVVDHFLNILPNWIECMVVITLTGVWPNAEDWPRFYGWRGKNGSKLSVYDMPGHLFELKDISELKELLTQVFEFGWEGYMLVKTEELLIDPIIFISHDG